MFRLFIKKWQEMCYTMTGEFFTKQNKSGNGPRAMGEFAVPDIFGVS